MKESLSGFKKINFSIATNTNGNAVVLALMVCVMVALMASTVPTLIGASEKQVRVSRVKSVMTNLENRVRRILMDPSSYVCPPVAGAVNPTTCSLDANRVLFPLRNTKVAGAQQCTPSSGAGVSCINPQINFTYNLGPGNTMVLNGNGNLQFSGSIAYNNADVNIQPINIQMEIPVDVVNIKSINCGVLNGGQTPVFRGFDTGTGMPKCEAIDSVNNCNQPGKYLSKIDTTTLKYTCKDNNTATNVNCGVGPTGGIYHFLSQLNWSAGNYTFSCALPASAFSLPASFPFNANICAGGSGLCTAPVVTTTTVTTTTTTTIPLVTAACGAANMTLASATPANTPGNLCAIGNTASPLPSYDSTNKWYAWTCVGAASSTLNCHTASNNGVVNGACDPVAVMGTHLYIPTTFCAAGAVSPNPPTFSVSNYRWEWQCIGTNGGSTVSCHADKTPDIGLCETVAPTAIMPVVSPSVMPPNSLCKTGSVSAVTNPTGSPWNWTWTCGFGSNQVNCSTHKIIAGVCAAPTPAASYAAPTSGLCSAGNDPATAVAVLSGSGTTFEWTCPGIHGGASSPTCSSLKMIDGVCEPSENGQALVAAPTIYCSQGTPVGVSGTGPWSWSCAGVNGGANSPGCATTVVPINGVCGSDNGQILTAVAPTNFCSTGTMSGLTGTGPWSWNCDGTGGGATVGCSANKSLDCAPLVNVTWTEPGGRECSISAPFGTNGQQVGVSCRHHLDGNENLAGFFKCNNGTWNHVIGTASLSEDSSVCQPLGFLGLPCVSGSFVDIHDAGLNCYCGPF